MEPQPRSYIGSLLAVLAIIAVFAVALPSSRQVIFDTVSHVGQGTQLILGSKTSPSLALSRTKVIDLTNKERAKQGLPLLVENSKLDKAAEMKMNDLFTQQYFDHISPQGHGPSWLADQASYSYVVVGENLALGDFKDDAALIAAWMASPGHRANILNPQFEDIGVAVGQGTYQGKTVWIAVQEFGKPLSDCPTIDSSLRSKIEADRASTDSMSADLSLKKQQLGSAPRSTPEEQAAYNQKVADYNQEVAAYNSAVNNLKDEIQRYNLQVQSFNACIKQ